jgi:hypothetical protein
VPGTCLTARRPIRHLRFRWRGGRLMILMLQSSAARIYKIGRPDIPPNASPTAGDFIPRVRPSTHFTWEPGVFYRPRQRLSVSGVTGKAAPLAGEEPAGRGKEGPVGGGVPRPPPPPAHPQLMAEHGDCQLPVIDAHSDEQAEEPAQDAIQEEREHGRSLTPSPLSGQRRMSTARSSLFTPHPLPQPEG